MRFAFFTVVVTLFAIAIGLSIGELLAALL